MKEILQLIIENLVEAKEQISINEKQEENRIAYEVKVAKEDMGRVIGKEGKIARSIRTIMKSVASKQQKSITIEFID